MRRGEKTHHVAKQPFNLNSIICPSPSVDASGIGTRKSDVSIPGASEGPPERRISSAETPLRNSQRAALRGRLTWWRSLKSTLADFKPPADSGGPQFIHPRDTTLRTLRHSLMNYLRQGITGAPANNLIGAASYFTCVICVLS